jgi:hypothetical protein
MTLMYSDSMSNVRAAASCTARIMLRICSGERPSTRVTSIKGMSNLLMKWIGEPHAGEHHVA